MPARNIAILLFEDVEVLDFCRPLEVFSVTGQSSEPKPFCVYTVAEKPGPIVTVNGLSVNPAFDFSNCPRADILIVPGGIGTRKEMHNDSLLRWITVQANQVELLISVCTGACCWEKPAFWTACRRQPITCDFAVERNCSKSQGA